MSKSPEEWAAHHVRMHYVEGGARTIMERELTEDFRRAIAEATAEERLKWEAERPAANMEAVHEWVRAAVAEERGKRETAEQERDLAVANAWRLADAKVAEERAICLQVACDLLAYTIQRDAHGFTAETALEKVIEEILARGAKGPAEGPDPENGGTAPASTETVRK